MMQHQDGNERAILYSGRDFTNTEKNYNTTEKEALAIEEFRPYLPVRHFTIVTNHQALKWLLSIKDPTGKLAV